MPVIAIRDSPPAGYKLYMLIHARTRLVRSARNARSRCRACGDFRNSTKLAVRAVQRKNNRRAGAKSRDVHLYDLRAILVFISRIFPGYQRKALDDFHRTSERISNDVNDAQFRSHRLRIASYHHYSPLPPYIYKRISSLRDIDGRFKSRCAF